MNSKNIKNDITNILLTKEEIHNKLSDLARQVEIDYKNKNLLIIGVLKGAIMVVADFVRELNKSVEMDWMALSSYGSGTKSSGSVKIIKDINIDLSGKNILIVEDIIDSGLTLSWLYENLLSRGSESVEILTLLSKPDAIKVDIDVKYIGFEIPNTFVVGYGLDYNEKYRNLPFIGILSPAIYE